MKCVYDGVIDTTPPDLCQGVIFLEPHDVIVNQSFNTDIFLIVIGALLVSFITGHFSGRTVRWLGKL